MIIQNPLIGQARKKLGGSVASKWNGLNVLKSKPLTVANPRTPGQVTQRNKLSVFSELVRLLAAVINTGWSLAKPTGQSARSASMKSSYPDLIFDLSGNGITNPEVMKVSAGALVPTDINGSITGTNVTVTWSGTAIPDSNQATSDVLYLAVIASDLTFAEQPVAVFSLGAVSRNAGTVTVSVAALDALGASAYIAYAFFKSVGSPTLISNSTSISIS